jgi:hypothetical protein
MYRVREQMKMLIPDIAIASLVEKLKNIIVKGTTAPPPPIPPMVDSVIKITITKSPKNSRPIIGKMSLCTHC